MDEKLFLVAFLLRNKVKLNPLDRPITAECFHGPVSGGTFTMSTLSIWDDESIRTLFAVLGDVEQQAVRTVPERLGLSFIWW